MTREKLGSRSKPSVTTKTTINLPTTVLREARTVAHREGTTLREIFLAGLRSELERRRDEERTVKYEPVIFGGDGLHPDVEGLDMHQILMRTYEEHEAKRLGEDSAE